jgi:hypothetical protein
MDKYLQGAVLADSDAAEPMFGSRGLRPNFEDLLDAKIWRRGVGVCKDKMDSTNGLQVHLPRRGTGPGGFPAAHRGSATACQKPD